MKTNVTQVMVAEHQLILRMISLIEKKVALVEENKFNNWTFFLDAVDFIRNFADRFHHAKEEDVLFVELVKNGMPEKQSPIEAMLIEHDQGRQFVRELESAAKKTIAGDSEQIPAIIMNAKGYAELLRGHIDKEDTILYPLAERVLPEGIRPDMLHAYDSAEEKADGVELKYRHMVEFYELKQNSSK